MCDHVLWNLLIIWDGYDWIKGNIAFKNGPQIACKNLNSIDVISMQSLDENRTQQTPLFMDHRMLKQNTPPPCFREHMVNCFSNFRKKCKPCNTLFAKSLMPYFTTFQFGNNATLHKCRKIACLYVYEYDLFYINHSLSLYIYIYIYIPFTFRCFIIFFLLIYTLRLPQLHLI